MPPRMFPTATETSPESAAVPVMASSGRLVATARRIRPPSAVPRYQRSLRTSVVSERAIPAPQTTAADPRKITRSSHELSPGHVDLLLPGAATGGRRRGFRARDQGMDGYIHPLRSRSQWKGRTGVIVPVTSAPGGDVTGTMRSAD